MEEKQVKKSKDNAELEVAKILKQARKVNTNQVYLSNVVSGIKYIVEHQHSDYSQVALNLIKLGCTYSKQDILNQAGQKEINVKEGMKKGDIYAGAMLICDVRDNLYGINPYAYNLMREDNEYSVYNYVRNLSGDDNYTKDNILGISENIFEDKNEENYNEI